MSPDRIIDSPRTVTLARYDPADTGGYTQETAATQLSQLQHRLNDLQDRLYGAATHSVLVVLQGMDTSGKDGTIKHVMWQMNPSGCEVTSFKVPTEEELRHDYLWRVHQHAPARGMIMTYNRSHYEDVVTARVHGVVSRSECRQRYEEINAFEQLLHRNGTLLLKFFLHISKEEQRKRLLAREDDKDKAWKLSVADWQERGFWDDYQDAYEKALGHCGTRYAPWYIIPADHKWYRNFLVARMLIDRLEEYEPAWKESLEERGKLQLQALWEAHLPDRESGDGKMSS